MDCEQREVAQMVWHIVLVISKKGEKFISSRSTESLVSNLIYNHY